MPTQIDQAGAVWAVATKGKRIRDCRRRCIREATSMVYILRYRPCSIPSRHGSILALRPVIRTPQEGPEPPSSLGRLRPLSKRPTAMLKVTSKVSERPCCIFLFAYITLLRPYRRHIRRLRTILLDKIIRYCILCVNNDSRHAPKACLLSDFAILSFAPFSHP